VDEVISIPEGEYQAHQNDTQDILGPPAWLPTTEIGMKRQYLRSLRMEELFALPMCYTPESLVGRLVTRSYHEAVACATSRAWARAESREHYAGAEMEGQGKDNDPGGRELSDVETDEDDDPDEDEDEDQDDEGEGEGEDEDEDDRPIWTASTQHLVGCCPVCVDVKPLAWMYHDRKQGEIAVCGRCHFFHLHNTCLF
jgi:hypothetical protein